MTTADKNKDKRTRTAAQSRADKRYYAKQVRKIVDFKEYEQDLIEFVKALPNFTQYVKDKIRNDLKNK